MDTLSAGQQFPPLQGRAVDGSTLRIPDDLGGGIAVLIFYRGHW
jgi:peroxiredoxin